ncbi:unnamed protein product [Effrenium voratum]|uniref:Uncharacterized protein n=1 Tax=Effrenium voratum TaxID=2562239 RepID=A0AA36JPL1_9DINO|nr:unnamed protein product [Effrenium voratum]
MKCLCLGTWHQIFQTRALAKMVRKCQLGPRRWQMPRHPVCNVSEKSKDDLGLLLAVRDSARFSHRWLFHGEQLPHRSAAPCSAVKSEPRAMVAVGLHVSFVYDLG